MSSRLGILFEPYAIVILDLLLQSFADGSGYVQTSASAAAKVLMGQLSGHGVKMIMPKILGNMEDTKAKWQVQRASIVMLGAMSSCAPKQLSTCLPAIVPNLVEAFHNTHKKVRESAKRSLQDVAKVVRNPEIASLSAVLIEALTNPVVKTGAALEALTETSFVHAIDSPSLALIVPILQRGLRNKKTEVKRPAAVIVGSMCSLISRNSDLEPYLDALMPHIKAIVLDPIPEVRMVAATAISSLYGAMGEVTFPQMVPWLLETLMSNAGSVERSGAAQSLSQILAHADDTKMNEIIGTVLAASTHPKPHVREGVMWMLTFLPSALPDARYSSLLSKLLESVVMGLSDEEDGVRTVAMKAGEMCVVQNAAKHVATIVPVLEQGLQDTKWRIRVATIKLLGDLLFEVGETHAIGNLGENAEVNMASMQTGANILRVLGREMRDVVIASVYIARSDANLAVRQHANLVWKSVIYNTPSTIRDTLTVIMDKLFVGLVHSDEDQKAQAGRCLGEIVMRLGERVMSSIVPVLEEGLNAEHPSRRQGVCFGLGEVVRALPERNGEAFLQQLVRPVLKGLCDEDAGVRRAASQAFKNLHNLCGQTAVSYVVRMLLSQMTKKQDSRGGMGVKNAILGLSEAVFARPTGVLQYMSPLLNTEGRCVLNWAQTHAIQALARSRSMIDNILRPVFKTYFRSVELITSNKADTKKLPRRYMDAAEITATEINDTGSTVDQMGLSNPDDDEDDVDDEFDIHNEDLSVYYPCLEDLTEAVGELADRTDTVDGMRNFVSAVTEHLENPDSTAVRVNALQMLERVIKASTGRGTAGVSKTGDDAHTGSTAVAGGTSEDDSILEPMLPILFRELAVRYNDSEKAVCKAAASCLATVVNCNDKSILAEHIGFLRNQFSTVVSTARHRTGGVGSSGIFMLPGLNQVRHCLHHVRISSKII